MNKIVMAGLTLLMTQAFSKHTVEIINYSKHHIRPKLNQQDRSGSFWCTTAWHLWLDDIFEGAYFKRGFGNIWFCGPDTDVWLDLRLLDVNTSAPGYPIHHPIVAFDSGESVCHLNGYNGALTFRINQVADDQLEVVCMDFPKG